MAAETKKTHTYQNNKDTFGGHVFYEHDFVRMVTASQNATLQIQCTKKDITALIFQDENEHEIIYRKKQQVSNTKPIFIFQRQDKHDDAGYECIIKIDHKCSERDAYQVVRDVADACPFIIPFIYTSCTQLPNTTWCVEIMPRVDSDMFDFWVQNRDDKHIFFLKEYYDFLGQIYSCLMGSDLQLTYNDLKPQNIGIRLRMDQYKNLVPGLCLLDIGGFDDSFTVMMPSYLHVHQYHDHKHAVKTQAVVETAEQVKARFIWQQALNIMYAICIGNDDTLEELFVQCFFGGPADGPEEEAKQTYQMQKMETQVQQWKHTRDKSKPMLYEHEFWILFALVIQLKRKSAIDSGLFQQLQEQMDSMFVSI